MTDSERPGEGTRLRPEEIPYDAEFLDTSILVRLDEPNSPLHPAARTAVRRRQERGIPMYIAPQVLIEFWAVATRPAEDNGLEMTPAQAREKVREFKALFHLAPDIPEIFEEWERLVDRYGVSGKPVHDTRLVAVMIAYGIGRMMTFNAKHFNRFAGLGLTFARPESEGPSSAEEYG